MGHRRYQSATCTQERMQRKPGGCKLKESHHRLRINLSHVSLTKTESCSLYKRRRRGLRHQCRSRSAAKLTLAVHRQVPNTPCATAISKASRARSKNTKARWKIFASPRKALSSIKTLMDPRGIRKTSARSLEHALALLMPMARPTRTATETVLIALW